MPDEGINHIEFPEIMHQVWRWFIDLSAARSVGMGGALGITYLDIHAYSQLHGIRFESWELSAIRQLDNAFLNSQYEKNK